MLMIWFLRVLISMLCVFLVCGCSNKGTLLPILVAHGPNEGPCSGSQITRYARGCMPELDMAEIRANANQRTAVVNKNNQKVCVLAEAVSSNTSYAVRGLLANGADYLKCDPADQDLYTSWISQYCKYDGDPDVLFALSQYGVPLGDDVVFVAAERACMPALKLLVEQRADLNRLDAAGWRPLDRAIAFGKTEQMINALAYLVSHGANPHLTASDGKSPLERATESAKASYYSNWPRVKSVLSQQRLYKE